MLLFENKIRLLSEDFFQFANGLWTGKKQPLKKVNVIRNTNFTTFGNIDTSDVAVIDVDEKQFENRKLINGDIIIERSGGGPKQPVGRVVFFDLDENDNYSFSNFTSLIRSRNPNRIKPRFLFYSLLNFYFNGDIQRFQSQTTGLRNLDFNKYKDAAEIALIDEKEQENIILTLNLIQSAIQKQEQIIRTTTDLKNVLMQKLFTEGTKGEAQKQTEIGLIPESWEVRKIENVGFNFLGGGTPSTKNDKYWIGDIHWTTSKRVATDKIYLEDGERRISKIGLENSSSNVVPKNNLIVSTRVTVGKVAINLVDMAISQDLTGILINRKKYCLEFLAYQILTERVQRIFKAQKRGATIKGITREDLKDILLAIPKTKTEQEEVANSLMVLDRKLQHHQTKKQTLTALFRSMLHQLMTGQIRVKDLNIKKSLKLRLPVAESLYKKKTNNARDDRT